MIRLVKPSIKYKSSFLAAEKEFAALRGERHGGGIRYKTYVGSFSKFVHDLRLHEKGIGLPKGHVPASTLWLVDRETFIGSVNIRHRLSPHLRKIGGHIGYEIRPARRRRGYGKKLLALALFAARKLGIKKALITCDVDNIASRKVIESNGGVFESKIKVPNFATKRRYWIRLDK